MIEHAQYGDAWRKLAMGSYLMLCFFAVGTATGAKMRESHQTRFPTV
jgi:hypothetical protein